MNIRIIAILICLSALFDGGGEQCFAQPVKERSVRYMPDGDDFVIVNGDRRFNRALYGGHTGFRVETGDVPEFALYLPRMGGNLTFSIATPSDTVALNDAEFIECRYRAGQRFYKITDSHFADGVIEIAVVACHDEDAAIWKITTSQMPHGTRLLWRFGGVANKRFSREGDMGVDRKDCFDMLPEYCNDNRCVVPSDSSNIFRVTSPENKYGHYVVCGYSPKHSINRVEHWAGETTKPYIVGACDISENDDYYFKIGLTDGNDSPASAYRTAVEQSEAVASRIRFTTPDLYLNTLGGALATAADGIWDGTSWLHGAIGWRMPLAGWRAAYAGDVLGWHDRARSHFDAYAASQVTDIEPRYAHPYQDTTLHMARAAKVWGTQMYSNGYICRNPNRNNQMHHYDMNLNYIDELLWHLAWTGDKEYARRIFPVIERHLSWEKRNFDPDGDGLYDAYCCIWASDALYYNGGAVTHSSALNYRANSMAAEIARLLGETDKAEYYDIESQRIAHAIDSVLWVDERGVWAEYKDLMGLQRRHTSPALWTVYHAIDCNVGTPLQRYMATKYVDDHIPHITIEGKGVERDKYATLSTTSWQPYIWSINNVAFAEVMHTALAYWQAGRYEEGYKLLKSIVMDGMYMGGSPGNFGQISYYDVARGECYRDFGDPVGIASRMFVQGLYGVEPDRLKGVLTLRPGFPREWDSASLQTPDIRYSFNRNGTTDSYACSLSEEFSFDTLRLQVRAYMTDVKRLTVNDKEYHYKIIPDAVELPMIEIPIVAHGERDFDIKIEWQGEAVNEQNAMQSVNEGMTICKQGKMSWIKAPQPSAPVVTSNTLGEQFVAVSPERLQMVNLGAHFNDSVTNIFKPRYLSPRPSRTTLQIPIQGIGDWCHPTTTFSVNDEALRKTDTLHTALGVPFLTPKSGCNVIFTTLWDNFPSKCIVPLEGRAERIYLMMAGSTNAMQSRIENAVVRIVYTDDTADTLSLVNPDTWLAIEQDYYNDGKAFRLEGERPYRLHLMSGTISKTLSADIRRIKSEEHSIDGNSTAISDNVIEGGAATLYDLPLNSRKRLKCLHVETLSNDIVVGLLGVTLQRPK